uniref:RING-type domain-containing protein n=1 Tax=Steinernema glaseri TaxID=37863 RepID=A0A1I7ZHX7_9BILA
MPPTRRLPTGRVSNSNGHSERSDRGNRGGQTVRDNSNVEYSRFSRRSLILLGTVRDRSPLIPIDSTFFDLPSPPLSPRPPVDRPVLNRRPGRPLIEIFIVNRIIHCLFSVLTYFVLRNLDRQRKKKRLTTFGCGRNTPQWIQRNDSCTIYFSRVVSIGYCFCSCADVRAPRLTRRQRQEATKEWRRKLNRPGQPTTPYPQESCSICFELSTNPVGCNRCKCHIGCMECVANWFIRNRVQISNCPLCRNKWENEPQVFKIVWEN